MKLPCILLAFLSALAAWFIPSDARVSRAIDLYTRECMNNTCKYVLYVSNTEKNSNAKTSQDQDLGTLKVLIQQLYTDVKKDAIKAAAITRGLTASVMSLTGEILKIQKQNNFTDSTISTLKKELELLKHNVSSMLMGKWHDLQPVIVHPANPDENLTKAQGVDCAALYKSGINSSGVYTLQPDQNNAGLRFDAACDMQNNGGGWTIIQRRAFGSDDFFRGWDNYKHGFGGLYYDFWIGLEKIHTLTNFGNTKMRIDMYDWEGSSRYSEFSYVRVSDEADFYRILAGNYSGNGGDPFHTQRFSDRMQGMRFSTFDRDNDLDRNGNCAMTFTSGWWFNNCFIGNLNGVWYGNSSYIAQSSNGIIWDLWTEHPRGYSLRYVEIKLRPEKF